MLAFRHLAFSMLAFRQLKKEKEKYVNMYVLS